jgi:hypothetical protein
MNEQKIMLVILVTLGVMLVAGLMAIPAAQAVVSRSELDKQIREQVSKGTSGLDGLKERITSQVSQGLHGSRPTG